VRLADLDDETRKIVFLAHAMVTNPSSRVLRRLKFAIRDFDLKHEAERTQNLLRALFEEEQ